MTLHVKTGLVLIQNVFLNSCIYDQFLLETQSCTQSSDYVVKLAKNSKMTSRIISYGNFNAWCKLKVSVNMLNNFNFYYLHKNYFEYLKRCFGGKFNRNG